MIKNSKISRNISAILKCDEKIHSYEQTIRMEVELLIVHKLKKFMKIHGIPYMPFKNYISKSPIGDGKLFHITSYCKYYENEMGYERFYCLLNSFMIPFIQELNTTFPNISCSFEITTRNLNDPILLKNYD